MKILSFIFCFFIAFSTAAQEEENDDLLIAEQDIIFDAIQGAIGGTANIILGGESPDSPDSILAQLSYTLNYGLMSAAILLMIASGAKWVTQLSGDKKAETLLDFKAAPLKFMMVVILLLPLPSGYSSIQYLVIKVGGEGISLANKLVAAADNWMNKKGNFTTTTAVMNADQLILNLMESSICVALINHSNKKTNTGRKALLESDLDDNIYNYSLQFGGIHTQQQVISMYQQDIQSNFANGRTAYYEPDVCGTSLIKFGTIDEKYVETTQVLNYRQQVVDAYKELADSVMLLAAEFTDHLLVPLEISAIVGPTYNTIYPQNMEKKLQQLSKNFRADYQSALNQLVANIDEGHNNGENKIEKFGATYLGIYFWEYARKSNVTSSIAKVQKSYSSPDYNQIFTIIDKNTYQKIEKNKNNLFKKIRRDRGSSMKDRTGQSTSQMLQNLEQNVETRLSKAEHQWDLFGSDVFEIATAGILGKSDPVLAYQQVGHNLMIGGEIMMLTSATVAKTAKVAAAAAHGSALAAASTPFTGIAAIPAMAGMALLEVTIELGNFMAQIGLGIMILGAFMAIYMSTIPLFHWISGLVGFMIVFLQAVILTPLLALAHLLSNEEGLLSSKTQHGYMSILQLFVYLPIMVVSFFIAYLVAMFSTKLIQILFVPYLQHMLADTTIGLVTGLFVTALFVLFNTQLLNRAFGLITSLPEKAGKFLGGGEEMLGDNNGEQGMRSGFVAVSSRMESGAQSPMHTAQAAQAAKGQGQAKAEPEESSGGEQTQTESKPKHQAFKNRINARTS